jgi:hypothetical protein
MKIEAGPAKEANLYQSGKRTSRLTLYFRLLVVSSRSGVGQAGFRPQSPALFAPNQGFLIFEASRNAPYWCGNGFQGDFLVH